MSSENVFEPQLFERREVGKKISSTKLQFIWKFKIQGKEVTVELFNSKMSGKKKILVNSKVIYEQKNRADTFTYPFKAGKNTIYIVEVSSGLFDLRVNDKSFEKELARQKKSEQFDWNNRQKHDAFEVRDFGTNLDKVYEPNTRDKTRPKAYQSSQLERDEMSISNNAAAQSHKDVLKARQQKVRTEKRRQEQRQQDNFNFDTGFDHGFEQLGTFKTGTDDHITATVTQDEANNNASSTQANQNQSQGGDFNFDFNSSTSGTQQQQQKPQNLDDLLDLNTNTNNVPAQNQMNNNVFDLNNLNTNNAQPSMNNQTQNAFDPFSTNNQQQQEEVKFVPKPMETYQTAQQQQMMQQVMMQQMMMQQMQSNMMNQQMNQQMNQNQFMTNYQQQQQMPMQPQFYNGGQTQQNQQQQQQQQNNNSGNGGSTPFDVFSI